MDMEEHFKLLGIEKTSDQGQIKKAYAKKARQYHPEVFPKEWKKLYHAYQEALKYAKGQQKVSEKNLSIASTWMEQEQKENQNTSDELEQIFKQLDQVDEKPLEQSKSELLKYLKVRRMKIFLGAKYWKTLFAMEAYHKCRDDDDCVREILKLIVNKRYFYPAFQVINWNLWELKIYLQGMTKYALVKEVDMTISKVDRQWNLSEEKQRFLEKSHLKGIWIVWQNLFQIPFVLRMVIVIALAACLYVCTGNMNGFLITYNVYFWLECSHLLSLWLGRQKKIKKTKSKQGTKKKVKAWQIWILVIGIILIALSNVSESNPAREHEKIVLETEDTEWEVLLYAKFRSDVLSKEPMRRNQGYIFYLLDKGQSDQQVLVIENTKQIEFQKVLKSGAPIDLHGYYDIVSTDDVAADIIRYMELGRDINELLGNNRIVLEAEPWLGRVFRVTWFEVDKESVGIHEE